MAFIKRNVPLPAFAPPTKRTGLADDLASLAAGESAVVQYKAAAVKQACKRVVAALMDAGLPAPTFAVWPSQADGSAAETGEDFALVAHVTDAQANVYESQKPGSTIGPRTYVAKAA
jgi:hypothetical protein